MADSTCILTVVKHFNYRGNANEEWSNTYAFTGSTPADSAAWRALFDAVVLQEKTILDPGTAIIGGYGYDHYAHDTVHDRYKTETNVWTLDLIPSAGTIAGTYIAAHQVMQGDTALTVRWGLDRLNTKGKRVYLRKYFHPALTAASGTANDVAAPTWVTAANAYAAKLWDGTLPGSRKLTDHRGSTVIGHLPGPYTTTRTLKRRGKRPS